MKLLSPSGVRVSVSDERGEALRKLGYKVLGESVTADSPEPVSESAEKPAPRRGRPAKQKNDENE